MDDFNRLEGGAAGIRRCDDDLDVSVLVDSHVTQDAEILDGEDWYLGIQDTGHHRTDIVHNRAHHVAPGCERCKCCISASK